METIQFYEAEGLARDDEFNELPDHIVVELEFMYFLSYRQVEALQKGEMTLAKDYKQKQDDFQSRFLGKWIQPFCTHIQNETDNSYYHALAGCLSAFNLGDCKSEIPKSK